MEVPGLPPESLQASPTASATSCWPESAGRAAPGPGSSFHCLERPHGRFERIDPAGRAGGRRPRPGHPRRGPPHRDPAAPARAARPRDRHPHREGAHGMNEERKDEEQPKIPDVLPVLPLRDIVIFPFMIVPALREPRPLDQGGGPGARREPHDPARRPEEAGRGRPRPRRHLPGRHRRPHHAHAEAARRAHPRAGAGPLPGPHRLLRRGPAPPPGADRDGERAGRDGAGLARGRGPDAQRQGRAREVAEPRQAHLPRGHRHRQQHGGAGPAGRPHRLQPRPEGRGGAGDPRGPRPGGAAAPGPRADDQGARGPHHAAGDLLPGQGGDGPQPARVLPAPAAQGDPVASWARATSWRRRSRSSARRPRRRRCRSRCWRRWSASSRSSSACTPTRRRPRPCATGSTGW